MKTNHIEIVPMSGVPGADIIGRDLAETWSGEVLRAVRRSLADRCVVVLRDQAPGA